MLKLNKSKKKQVALISACREIKGFKDCFEEILRMCPNELRYQFEGLLLEREQWDGIDERIFVSIKEMHKSNKDLQIKFCYGTENRAFTYKITINNFDINEINDEVKSVSEIEQSYVVKCDYKDLFDSANNKRFYFDIKRVNDEYYVVCKQNTYNYKLKERSHISYNKIDDRIIHFLKRESCTFSV